MTVINRTAARDDMLGLLNTAWLADSASQNLTLYFPDKPEQPVPSGSLGYARAQVQHATGGQASLAGDSGTSRQEKSGVLTVQIFTQFGKGLSLNDQLVDIVENAYEGKATTSGIWFRNVRSTEIGKSGEWFQTNVLIDFEYDLIR